MATFAYMATSRTYHSLHLDISSYCNDKICYLILPEKLKDKEMPWLDAMAEQFSCNFIVISGLEWEDDLTPWKAPGIKSGEFSGKAQNFLEGLKSDFFSIENSMRLNRAKRYLIGASLSGLFALWCTCREQLFDGIGSVSGSLWYDGFLEWMKTREEFHCSRYYFSLGKEEKNCKNIRMASVEQSTLEAIEILKSAGKDVYFEYNEGNHFGPLIERVEKAITNLLGESL